MAGVSNSVFRGRIGSILNPIQYKVSPKTSQQLATLRKTLKDESMHMPMATEPLPRRTRVVVYCKTLHSWERAEVRRHEFKDGKLLHIVYLVDRGGSLSVSNVRLASEQLLNELPPGAVQVELLGLKPAPGPDSKDKWCAEARELTAKLAFKQVIVRVSGHNANGVLLGDIEVRRKGGEGYWSVSEELLRRGWAVSGNAPLPEDDDGNESDSSADSFASAVSYFTPVPPTNKPDERTDAESARNTRILTELQNNNFPANLSDCSNGNISHCSSAPETSMTAEISTENNCFLANKTELKQLSNNNSSQANESSHDDSSVFSMSASSSTADCSGGKKSEESLIERLMPCTDNQIRKVSGGSGATVWGGGIRLKQHAKRNMLEREQMLKDLKEKEVNEQDENFNAAMYEADIFELEHSPNSKEIWNCESSIILTRSNVGEITPIELLEFVPFNRYIHARLREKRYEAMRTIQKYSFPAIMNGHNTVMVSEPRSGKTLGYILPVMNHLALEAEKQPFAHGHGPLAVIVCASARTCGYIHDICKRYANFALQRGTKSTRILAVHGGGAEKEKYVELTSGCELLIATAHCLARMLKMRHVTNFDRLKWLVFDDFNVLMSPNFVNATKSIMHLSQMMGKVQPIQYIVAAEKLSEKVWAKVKDFGQYSLLLGSHMEAAIYARLKPIAQIVAKEKKLHAAVDEIVGEIGQHRIVVVCRMQSEVLELEEALQRQGYEPLVLHGSIPHYEFKGVLEKWRTTDFPLLLCTDDSLMMQGFRIHDATFLLHYSIPVKSKVMFGTRFSLAMDYYRNHFKESDEDENDIKADKDVKILIYMDEETQIQLKLILGFLKRLEIGLCHEIVHTSKKIDRAIEEKKELEPLCTVLLGRGKCPNTRKCPSRHIVLPCDALPTPPAGQIVFSILSVLDTAHWGIRIHCLNDNEGKKHEIANKSVEIKEIMEAFFGDKNNWRCFREKCKIGDLCAARDVKGKFYRGKIKSIESYNKRRLPDKVIVEALDEGLEGSFKVSELMELPRKLRDCDLYPRQSVQMLIAGVLPVDFDSHWGLPAKDMARGVMDRKLGEDDEWWARIKLALPGVLVVEQPLIMRHLHFAQSIVPEFDYVEDLVAKGLAVRYKEHLALLEAFAKEGGLALDPGPKKPDPFKPQWAHFHEELPQVIFTGALSLQTVFVRQSQFDKLLTSLEDDCQKVGDWEVSRKKPLHWDVGAMYLARDRESKRWNRAQLQSVAADCATMLFVDYGDVANVALSDITRITRKLITQMPCQAIECQLGGLEDVHKCPQNIVDRIYDICQEGDDNCLAQVVITDVAPTVLGGKVYKLNLVDWKGRSIGRLIAEEFGLARKAAEEEFLNDIEWDEKSGDDDDDDDDDHLEDRQENWDVINVGVSGFEFKETVEEQRLVPVAELNLENFELGMDELDDEDLLRLWTGRDELTDTPNEGTGRDAAGVNAAYTNEEGAVGVNSANVTKEGDHFSAPNAFVADAADDELSRSGSSDSGAVGDMESTAESENGRAADVNKSVEKDSKIVSSRIGPRGAITPQVYWQENHDVLKLRIIISRVDEKRLRCYCHKFVIIFEAFNEEGQHYFLSLRLHGAVWPGSLIKAINPFEIRLILIKMRMSYWGKLKLDKERNRFIKFDPDPHLGVDTEEPESAMCTCMKCQACQRADDSDHEGYPVDVDSEADSLDGDQLF